eukprot:CAMPEP_0176019388 /NCGR_PEP_ID=MMETSP0120_2-20121206/9364_1 /TAXON_ID=160619 /ORGANISM="Kryptoperidinium foliaceum, Strain CCMP 1326" /LENGTH=358 /DNA_ID=CAMNT_0017352461 /DNA_START=31 /DNA_END=1107 /DNA_ORIENTATION=-
MVSFDVSPAIPSNEENHDDRKAAYRMTPYPLASVDDEDEKVHGVDHDESHMFDDEEDAPELQNLVSEVDSPEAATHNDTVSMQDRDSDEWEQWIEGVQDDSISPNLPPYLLAKADRMAAKKAFENALERILEGMHRAMGEELLADTVGVVYQDQGDRFDRLEGNIMSIVQSNHDRRQQMTLAVDQANEQWERRYKKIRSDILNEESKDDVPMMAQKGMESANAQKATVEANEAGEGANGETEEPNWEVIAAEYEPARNNVQSFLEHRDALRQAENAFVDALDEVTTDLRANAEAISQVLVDFYDKNEDEFVAMERELQYHLMNNHQRRMDLEQRLMEATKQSQGFFASLLSRLSGSAN